MCWSGSALSFRPPREGENAEAVTPLWRRRRLAIAKQRGERLGGWTAGSERSQQEAAAFAERMRPILAELASMSANQAAAELNRRKIATAAGGKWYPATVIRLRARISPR